MSNPWAYERDLEEGTERAERLSREIEDESLEAAINDHEPNPGCGRACGNWRHVAFGNAGFHVYRCSKCGAEEWL